MADSPEFSDRDGEYDWQVAGYLEAGYAYEDGYHNFDPDSPQERFEVESWQGDDFLPEADYVVVHITSGDDDFYVTLAGPFDDLDDLYDAIEDWWETGS